MTIEARSHLARSIWLVSTAALLGCGPSGTASFHEQLGVGAIAPEIAAEGWIDGDAPERRAGQVVVLEAWAHW